MNENLTNEHIREIHEVYDKYINDVKHILDIKQKLLHEVFDVMVNVIVEYDPMFDIDKNISIGERTVDLKIDDITFISLEYYRTNGTSIKLATRRYYTENIFEFDAWVSISISDDGKLIMNNSNPLRPMLREIVKQLDILVKTHNIKQTLITNN